MAVVALHKMTDDAILSLGLAYLSGQLVGLHHHSCDLTATHLVCLKLLLLSVAIAVCVVEGW